MKTEQTGAALGASNSSDLLATTTPKELASALRQYRCNSSTDGFVAGFDYDEVLRIFNRFDSQNRTIVAALLDAKNKLRGADVEVPLSVYRALDDFGG